MFYDPLAATSGRTYVTAMTRLLPLALLILMLEPGTLAQARIDTSAKPRSDASPTADVDKLFAPWDKAMPMSASMRCKAA